MTGSRRWLLPAIGLVVSAVAIYFAVRGIDRQSLLRVLSSVRVAPLLVAAVVAVAASGIRAMRWRSLFPSDVHVRIRSYFTIMMIGYLGNNVLPARAGDVIRAVLFGKRTGVGISRTAATLVVERVVDASSLLAIAGVLSFVLPLPPLLHRSVRLASVGCLVALLALIWLSVRPATRLPGMLGRFVEGLHALRNVRSLAAVIALTAAIWLAETVMVFLVMRASGVNAPAVAALFLLVVVSLGLLIPAGPASIGSYELFVILALSAFGIDKTHALGVGILLHATVFTIATSLGLICLWAESVSFRALPQSRVDFVQDAES